MRTSSSALIAPLLALAFPSTTSAQVPSSLINGLSGSCKSGLLGLVNSDFASCINLSNALILASAQGSIIQPLSSYVQGSICNAAPCSPAALSSANDTINGNCASDLSSNNGANVPAALQYVVDHYYTLRNALCLEDSNKANQLCVTEVLYGVQNTTGQNLTLDYLSGLTSSSSNAMSALSSLENNKTAFCTNCTHALYSVVYANGTGTQGTPLTSSETNQAKNAISNTCGANFVDGQIPAGIKNGTKGASGSGASTDAGFAINAPKTVASAAAAFIAAGAFMLA